MSKRLHFPYKTRYGRFSDDGKSFIINRPDTPRPWVNIMCSGTYGVAMSQTGSGYSWLHHASLNRITRWNQDLIRDDWGRYIYIRDENSGEFWSVGWQPVQGKYDFYECVHGVGYTTITSRRNGIQAQWMVFVPHEEPLEIWRLRIKNLTQKPRKLTLWSYMELNLGEAPDAHREFHKMFIETSVHDKGRIMLGRKRLWGLKNGKGQHWNRDWEYTAWHSTNLPARAVSGDKEAFLGRYGTLQNPEALRTGRYSKQTTGKWDDGIFSLCIPLALKGGQERSLVMTLGAAENDRLALNKAHQFQDLNQMDRVWHRTEAFWDKYISAFNVETPNDAFNTLTNTWLKYQTLSSRFWGRTAYYQTGGAFGYRDQLQDSQIFLPLEPDRTRQQIRLHASKQFVDGTVYHWWHPLSGEGMPSKYSDDLLWLPFVMINYLKETAQWSLLSEKVPYSRRSGERKSPMGSLYDHATRAIERVLQRKSSRGLPLIGEGDWNDGLSAAGADWKGESVWMGHFLYGILKDWAEMIHRGIRERQLSSREGARAKRYLSQASKLKKTINRVAWDGDWYLRATCDNGSVLGSHRNKEGRIFLNAQTWALLNGVVDTESKKKTILKSLERHLYGPHGPLLLAPAYTVPDEQVGYLTRYSPTSRENGGIYFHAAVWALQMECSLKRAHKAWDMYKRMCPILRGADNADKYVCEPYVTPGNVDGPGSPSPGRGGWTWYTGSAAWLYRVSTEWILGIRPDWAGLRIRPCLPPEWDKARAVRSFRGGTYEIQFVRDRKLKPGTHRVFFNDQKMPSDLLPVTPGRTNDVLVMVGPAKKRQ